MASETTSGIPASTHFQSTFSFSKLQTLHPFTLAPAVSMTPLTNVTLDDSIPSFLHQVQWPAGARRIGELTVDPFSILQQ